MKVAIVGSVGIPAKYGGFETLVHHLVKELKGKHDFTVYCSAKAYPEKLKEFESARLKYIPLEANGMQSIPYDIVSMFSAIAGRHDVLLILGVSGATILPFLSFLTTRKIILHIDGLEWKRNKWNNLAKKFLKFSEKTGVKNSHAIIADNASLVSYVNSEYGLHSNLIEYGADHIMQLRNNEEHRESYAFSVCRIEPENNVHLALEAFAQTGQPLIFVGNWNRSDYGKQLRQRYGKFENISMLDPIYDQEKLDRLRANCRLYIHGHSAGGTNPSLVEAMYLRLPVVAFDVSYNRATTEEQAVYFKDAQSLCNILQHLTQAELDTNAASMLSIAKRRYTWKIIASKYDLLFESVMANR